MPSVANEISSEGGTAAGGHKIFSASCLRCRPSVKLFVTDLDGTLLFSSLQVSKRAIAAFRRLQELGVQCAIATGRPLAGTVSCIGEETLQQLEMPHGQPGVYMNGSLVIGKNGERLHTACISQEQTLQILAIIEKNGWLSRISGYGEEGIFCLEADEFTLKLHESYGETAPQVVSREVFQNMPLCKIGVNASPEDLPEIRRTLEAALDDTDLRVVCPIPCSVEICPVQATKEAGLRVLLRQLNMQPEEVFAIGDSENDVEMLRFAGVSVAVGNAMPIAKAAAQFVTCRCDEDAVAKAAECVAEVLEERQGQKGHAFGGTEKEDAAAASKQHAPVEAAASPSGPRRS